MGKSNGEQNAQANFELLKIPYSEALAVVQKFEFEFIKIPVVLITIR